MKRFLSTILILLCSTALGFDNPQYRINGVYLKIGHALTAGGPDVATPEIVIWDPDTSTLASSGDIVAATDITAGGTATVYLLATIELTANSATITEATVGTLHSILGDAVHRLLIDSMGGGNGVQKTQPFGDPPNMKVRPTSPPSTSVVIQPGSGIVFQTAVAIVEDTTLTVADPVIFPHIDGVFVGPDGVPFIISGTPDPDPQPPGTPAPWQMLLYEIYVGAAPAVIEANDITDRRSWL